MRPDTGGAKSPRPPIELEIERLGAQGDGVATLNGAPVFIPFTLPGERVRSAIDGERASLIEVLRASPERAPPACRHFTHCGGCAMQHMAPHAYASWKRSLVIDAFVQRDLSARIEPTIFACSASRRRAMLSAVVTRAGVVLGFHAARDDTIIDIAECPVLEASIVAALPGVRSILAALPRWDGEVRVSIVAAANGLDVGIDGAISKQGLDAARSARLADKAAKLSDLARLSIDTAPIFQRASPTLAMGHAFITPPPGTFMQASALAERAMADMILEALPKKAKRAVDLFAGLGAFTFPLAERVAVTAVDNDRNALDALAAGVRGAQGLKPIATVHRDLFREPFARKELEGYDLAVFDPPRAGAKSQAEMLAKSKVPVVVAVSCNPATLARDARILVDGGYVLQSLTPVDQFHWSAHVEAVAVLRRTKR